jgi:hypothetical protein
MRFAFDRPARLAKALLLDILLAVPLLTLSAQSGGTQPQGTMSGPAPAAATAGQAPIAGIIASIEGSTLVLARPDGSSSRILLQSDTVILKREPATIDSIKPGEALGVAATPGADGSLTATVINIFTPELWRLPGTRKGQFPWPHGQLMTNAEVDRVVDKVEGRTIYLKYEMLSAAISVPAGADIRRMIPLRLSDLKAGLKVSVRLASSSDGSLRAAVVSAELPAS